MPHQCTNCGKTFPDGSKEMLSGCPECGGNKFQFRPAGSLQDDAASGRRSASEAGGDASDAAARTPADGPPAADTGPSADSNSTSDESEDATADTAGSSPSGATEPAKSDPDAVRSSSSASESENPTAGTSENAESDPAVDDDEDAAQASARRDVIEPDELASAVEREARDGPATDTGGQVIEPESDDRPGLDDLREELNQQFESIKIVNPGQYELNLMELYDRDEYIISLQEDGRYVIEVPDTWRDEESDEA